MSLAQTPDLRRSIRISSLVAGPVFLHRSLIGAISPLERRRVADLDASDLAQDVVLIRALGGGFHS